jgi:arginyl-tRNA synthetase
MARSDRVAQLMALLQEAREKGDTDKIVEIEADLFREYSMSMREGGIMNINDMLTPIGYEAKRIAEYDPSDPETFKESTYGTITDDIRTRVALQIARSQNDTSEANINKILSILAGIGGAGSKEESITINKKKTD